MSELGEKDIFAVKKYIKYDNIELPENIIFDGPEVSEAYDNARSFPPFERMSQGKWYYRSRKGKPIKISEIGGVKIFEGAAVTLQEIHPHKFIKVLNQFLLGRAPMPVVYKDENETYYNLSPNGLDMMTVLYNFKKDNDLMVWLVDESVGSKDFEDDDEMLGKEVYTPNYDYGNITDDDRILIREICEQLEKNGNESDSQFLKQQFQLKQAWQYDLANSPFVKICRDNDIKVSKQGYMTNHENNETREYPIISICEDIRKLEKLFTDILSLKLDYSKTSKD